LQCSERRAAYVTLRRMVQHDDDICAQEYENWGKHEQLAKYTCDSPMLSKRWALLSSQDDQDAGRSAREITP
jgi:hypothetical protein